MYGNKKVTIGASQFQLKKQNTECVYTVTLRLKILIIWSHSYRGKYCNVVSPEPHEMK